MNHHHRHPPNPRRRAIPAATEYAVSSSVIVVCDVANLYYAAPSARIALHDACESIPRDYTSRENARGSRSFAGCSTANDTLGVDRAIVGEIFHSLRIFPRNFAPFSRPHKMQGWVEFSKPRGTALSEMTRNA